LELKYRIVIIALRHPECDLENEDFWRYAIKIYGIEYFTTDDL